MPTVAKFEKTMVEKYLKSKDLKYMVDSDGDYLVRFAKDDEAGCGLAAWVILGGQQKEILVVRVESDKEFPQANWAQAIMACNTWNTQKRWPKVYLNPNGDNGRIFCEENLDLQTGVHQELLEDFISTVLTSAFQFWKWAHQEQGL